MPEKISLQLIFMSKKYRWEKYVSGEKGIKS